MEYCLNSDVSNENLIFKEQGLSMDIDFNDLYQKSYCVQSEKEGSCHSYPDSQESFSDGYTSSNDDNTDNNILHNEQNYAEILEDVRQWSFDFNVSTLCLNKLLKILKTRIPELPSCAKTLQKLRGPRLYNIVPVDNSNSEFVYFGIADQLKKSINPSLHLDNTIKLQFNVDGLPLSKSSNKEFWPILGKVFFKPDIYKPFTVAVYCEVGKSKNIDKYFEQFIEELNELLENGIKISNKNFKIEIMCFICDRPARAFLKGIKGHTGYNACERCVVKGCRLENRTLYPFAKSTKRTNNSFREQNDPEHHIYTSPLRLIKPSIDMVNQFVLEIRLNHS